MIGEVNERQPLDSRLRDERRSEARAAGKRIESLRTRIDAVRERMRGLDGGALTRLDAELRQTERALADITAGRQRIGRMFEAAGEEFPKDEPAWDERRIEAVTGEGAEKVLYAAEDTLQNVAEFLNNTQVVQAIKKIVESNDALSKEVEAMRQEQVREWADRLVKSLPEQNGVILMAKQSERMPAFIKDLAYNLRARVHNLVMVVGTCQEGKPSLTIMLGDDVVAKGVIAGKVIREAAREMNGGGGGQPFFATAGGKNPDKLQAAIDKAVELIMDELK